MLKANKSLIKLVGIALAISLCTTQITSASQNESSIDKKDTNFKTIEVEYGTYVEKMTLKNLSRSYLRSESLFIKDSSGVFVEYLVSSGSIVSKGDKLIAYEVAVDTVAIEENKIRLSQAEENYYRQLEQKEESMINRLEQLSNMDQNSIEAQILQVQHQKAQLELERFQLESQKNIESIKEAIEELGEQTSIRYVEAPYDGLFNGYDRWLRPGIVLNRNNDIGNIRDVKSVVLESKSTNLNRLWYGMNPTFTDMTGNVSKGTYQAKVIGEDSLFNGRASTEMIYVALEDPSQLASISQGDVVTDVVSVENVIVIPLNVVKFKDEVAYVYILGADGRTHKQYLTGRNNGSSMWVYNGLSAGQKIVAE